MCSTCNYNNFEEIIEVVNGNEIKKLENQLGFGSLLIKCDLDGKNYKLAVKDEPKSEFALYRCPTCGCKLF